MSSQVPLFSELSDPASLRALAELLEAEAQAREGHERARTQLEAALVWEALGAPEAASERLAQAALEDTLSARCRAAQALAQGEPPQAWLDLAARGSVGLERAARLVEWAATLQDQGEEDAAVASALEEARSLGLATPELFFRLALTRPSPEPSFCEVLALVESDDDAALVLARAVLAERAGDLEGARHAWASLLQGELEPDRLLAVMGASLLRGEVGALVSLAASFAESDPSGRVAALGALTAAVVGEASQDAEVCFRRALLLLPPEHELRWPLAEAAEGLGLDLAEAAFSALETTEASLRAARLAELRGDGDGAQAHLQAALERAPTELGVLVALGRQGDEEALRRLAELSRGDALEGCLWSRLAELTVALEGPQRAWARAVEVAQLSGPTDTLPGPVFERVISALTQPTLDGHSALVADLLTYVGWRDRPAVRAFALERLLTLGAWPSRPGEPPPEAALLEWSPGNRWAFDRLLRAADTAELAAAMDLLTQAIEGAPTAQAAAAALTRRAERREATEPEAAEADYRAALGKQPLWLPALQGLGRLLDTTARPAELAALCRHELALRGPDDPSRARLLGRLGELSERALGDPDAAIQAYQGVLALLPRAPDALLGLERLYSSTGRPAELAWVLGRRAEVVTAPRERASLLFRRGEVLDSIGDYEAAAGAFEAALSLWPELPTGGMALERLALATGGRERLADAYRDLMGRAREPLRLKITAHKLAALLPPGEARALLASLDEGEDELYLAWQAVRTAAEQGAWDNLSHALGRLAEGVRDRKDALGLLLSAGELSPVSEDIWEEVLAREPQAERPWSALLARAIKRPGAGDQAGRLERYCALTTDERAQAITAWWAALEHESQGAAYKAPSRLAQASALVADDLVSRVLLLERATTDEARRPLLRSLFELSAAPEEAARYAAALAQGAKTADEALHWWREAALRAPAKLEYAQAVEAALLAEGDLAELVRFLEARLDVLDLADQEPVLKRLAALLSDTLVEPTAALQVLERLVALTPKDAALKVRLADCLIALGREREAISPLTDALALMGDEEAPVVLQVRLGRLLARVGEPGDAIAVLRRAVGLLDADGEALSALAEVLASVGRQDEAARAFERLARLVDDPERRAEVLRRHAECAGPLRALEPTTIKERVALPSLTELRASLARAPLTVNAWQALVLQVGPATPEGQWLSIIRDWVAGLPQALESAALLTVEAPLPKALLDAIAPPELPLPLLHLFRSLSGPLAEALLAADSAVGEPILAREAAIFAKRLGVEPLPVVRGRTRPYALGWGERPPVGQVGASLLDGPGAAFYAAALLAPVVEGTLPAMRLSEREFRAFLQALFGALGVERTVKLRDAATVERLEERLVPALAGARPRELEAANAASLALLPGHLKAGLEAYSARLAFALTDAPGAALEAIRRLTFDDRPRPSLTLPLFSQAVLDSERLKDLLIFATTPACWALRRALSAQATTLVGP